MPPFFKKWGPLVISTAVFVILAIKDVIADNSVSVEDRYVVGIALVNAIVTFVVPNLALDGISRYVKPITHAALVALAFFVKAQTGDGIISNTEWIDGLVLALGALGVVVTVGPVWSARSLANGDNPNV